MCARRSMRCTSLLALAVAALAVLLTDASFARAGILAPQQVNFGLSDLDRALADRGAAGSSSSSADSRETPFPFGDRDSHDSDLPKLGMPVGHSTSTSTSSSTGVGAGSGIVLCLFSSTITITDDATLGRLPEDHGLSLPDPPGTDLLRPPRTLS